MRVRVVLLTAAILLAIAAPASAANFSVTGTTDSATGTCTANNCTTIRAALAAAFANGATTVDTISVPAGNYVLTLQAGGELPVNSNVTITGANAATTTIRGDGKNFRIVDVTGSGRQATIAHVTLMFGTTGQEAAANQLGGIVLVDAGATLALDHARVTQGAATRGGGIAIRSGTANITKSVIDTNQASQDGAGILALGASLTVAPATLTLTDSTVALNSNGTAAGITSQGGNGNSVTVTRSTIAYNSAGSNGGTGLRNGSGTISVSGSILANNTGDGTPDNCGGTITNGGGSADTGSACGFTLSNVQNGNLQLVSNALTPAGETQVLTIPSTSVAVSLAGACTGADQRDLPRPQGAACDAGAYEVDQVPDTAITSTPPALTTDNTPTFAFSSPEPGVTFECSLSTGAASYSACTTPLTYAARADGTYTFSVRAKDGTGNTDASPATFTLRIDTTPPNTTITNAPASNGNATTVSFAFTAGETATFTCSLTGPGQTGTPASCTSAKGYSGLAQGSYQFSVTATDSAGLADPSPATFQFLIDTTPPNGAINSGPTGPTNNASPTFVLSASEASTYQCRLDGPGAAIGTPAACPSTRTYGPLAQGTYTLNMTATDLAGNVDPSPATRSFTVDTTPPDTTLTGGPTGTTNVNSPSFTFTSEAGATFECKLDGPTGLGTYSACTSPHPYSGLANGAYTFSVRAKDAATNVDPSPAGRTFTVDATPPDPTITSGPDGPTTDPAPAFAFSAPEPGVTFACRLDGPAGPGTFGACTSPKSFSGLAPGAYTFLLRATDAIGNTSTTSRAFSVAAVQQATPTPTPSPTPSPSPTPVAGKSVVIQPVRGKTLVKLPGATKYTPVDVTIGIPLGSTVDTRKSQIRLFAIPKAGKPAESALFYDGIFKVTQIGGITQLQLVEALSCPKRGKAAAAAKKPKTRKLWGDGTGSFRTRGQYSAATVRGTKWLVQDSCTSTLTRVAKGVVSVQDFVKHKTLLVRAPKQYIARKKH